MLCNFPHKGPVIRDRDVPFVVGLNKRLKTNNRVDGDLRLQDAHVTSLSWIGYNENAVHTIDGYANHPGVKKRKNFYDVVVEKFDFHSVEATAIMFILKSMKPNKATWYNPISG